LIWLFPGSFDPPTLGHLDLIQRASLLCDTLVVAVLVNDDKCTAFSPDERVEMLRLVTEDLDNVEVCSFSGLTVELAKERKATVLLRGLRNAQDLEFEQQIAAANRQLAPDVETVFFPCKGEYAHISSTVVRSVALHGGFLIGFVPQEIIRIISNRFRLERKK
jgi:pantetheine-phosphate adenylyltransferase